MQRWSNKNMLTKKICLVGDFGVGKTSLINRYVNNEFGEEYLTTVGVKLDTKLLETKDNTEVKLIIWDIAGSDSITPAKRSYIDGASGYIAVYDLTRPKTLQALKNIQETVEEMLGEVPFIVAANKNDLEDVAGDADGNLLEKSSMFLRTSALTGAGVEAAFETLAQAIVDAS